MEIGAVRLAGHQVMRSFPLRPGNAPQNGSDPCRGVTDVPKELPPVVVGQPLLQTGYDCIIHVPLTDMAQGLDDQSRYSSGSRHGAGGGVFEHDDLLAKLHAARWSITEENDFHRHLIGEPQQIGGISPGRLQKNFIPPLQRLDDGIGRGGKETEVRVEARVIIQPAGQAAQRSFFRQTVQRQVHGLPASKVDKIALGDNATLPTTIDTIKYF